MSSHGYKCPDSFKEDPILKMIDKCRAHSSIKLIEAKNISQVFMFNQIKIDAVNKLY